MSDTGVGNTTFSAARRRLLGAGAAALVGMALPSVASAGITRKQGKRSLAFYNLHTGESLETVYWRHGIYRPEALKAVNWILRDFRTGTTMPIDRDLLDLLHRLERSVAVAEPFRIISGYRSPKTNAMLRARSSGVAKRSLHMEGRAADIALAGVPLSDLRGAALALRAGGVGYYPRSGFVHVDTGRVRHW